MMEQDGSEEDEKELLEVSLNMVQLAMMSVHNTEGLEVLGWNNVSKATQEDPWLVRLIEEVERGIPESSYDMEQELRVYH
jgi:hypothetical protein